MTDRAPHLCLVRTVIGAALLAATLAGCGSTSVRHVTTTITRSSSGSSSTAAATSAATASSATTSSAATTRPARSPRAELAAAAAALRTSNGYAMRADLVQNGARTVITLSTTGAKTFDATLDAGSSAFSVIALPHAAYLRANVAFWRARSGVERRRAAQLAGHWLQVPASGPDAIGSSLGTLAPGTLARCLVEDHGTLSFAGRTTVAGTPAFIVRDAGNAPGSTPSTIAIAAGRGPAYPLRYTATGRTRAGGRIDVCNDGKGDGATGTITIDDFGDVATIHAPAGAQSDSGAPLT